jgi:ketosteroid isomerase-like protein
MQSIDRRDTDAFLKFLAEDAVFRFGNAEPINGKVAIGAYVGGFFSALKALDHEVLQTWTLPKVVIYHGLATYTRQDSSTLTVPFCNVLTLEGECIKEYLIFTDNAALFPA